VKPTALLSFLKISSRFLELGPKLSRKTKTELSLSRGLLEIIPRIQENRKALSKFNKIQMNLAHFSQSINKYLLKFKIFLDKPYLFKIAIASKNI
jgi:hypothetical protein